MREKERNYNEVVTAMCLSANNNNEITSNNKEIEKNTNKKNANTNNNTEAATSTISKTNASSITNSVFPSLLFPCLSVCLCCLTPASLYPIVSILNSVSSSLIDEHMHRVFG